MTLPLLEDDQDEPGVIEPTALIRPHPGMPEAAVLCFFHEVLAEEGEPLLHLSSELGRNPVRVVERDGRRVAVTHPGVGAPLAAAAAL